MYRWAGIAVCAAFGLSLTACDLAPFYKPPPVKTAPAYKETDGDWHAGAGTQTVIATDWWTAFNDPVLNTLESQVTPGNQSLKAALARYDQARAALVVAGAALFPVVTGTAGATGNRSSGNTQRQTSTKPYGDYTLGLTVGYELDVWGRIRNAVASAGDQAKATADDAAALDLDLHAQVASGYFALRGYDTELDILNKSVANYQGELTLTRRRFQGGIALASDVDQAEQEVDNAQAQLQSVRLQRDQREHALAVLVGQTPSAFSLPPAPLALNLPPIDPGVPSSLLERRPDIAAAERRVAAANAEVGVARAAYFPSFDLAGDLGLESTSLSKLLRAPSLYWSLGPSLTQTVFDAGEISALTDEARAVYDEQVADYRQTSLSAFQDVEDNLSGVRQLTGEEDSQKLAAAAADRTLQQAYNRYHGGIDTSLDLAIQENMDLQAHLSLVETQISHATSYVRLIEALGGGWQAQAPALAVIPDTKPDPSLRAQRSNPEP